MNRQEMIEHEGRRLGGKLAGHLERMRAQEATLSIQRGDRKYEVTIKRLVDANEIPPAETRSDQKSASFGSTLGIGQPGSTAKTPPTTQKKTSDVKRAGKESSDGNDSTQSIRPDFHSKPLPE